MITAGYQGCFQSKLSLFHPMRHIPRTNPNGDLNISPVEGNTFANCRSMENIQILTQSGGVNKYVCKHIAKMDEQNFVIVKTDSHKNGKLVKKSAYLHKNESPETKKNEKNVEAPQGRIISHMEILHQILQCPEESIQTFPKESRTDIRKTNRTEIAQLEDSSANHLQLMGHSSLQRGINIQKETLK